MPAVLFSLIPLLSFAACRAARPKSYAKDIYMNVDQHLKVAQWHIEQARLHATSQHSCGCPVNEHYQSIIDEVEAGKIEEEKACAV